MSLVKHPYNKYRWTCVGTIVPTEKNERASHDLPFHILSNGARNMIERGWYREAAIKLRAENSKHEYYIQCSTRKDKKQVMFQSNNKVGRSVGLTVSRRVRGKSVLTRFLVHVPRQTTFRISRSLIGMIETVRII